MDGKTDFKRVLVRAMLPHIMLSEVSRQPMHGYALTSAIRRKYGVSFSHSTIYPALQALQKAGLLTCEWQFNGGRARKVYVLTDRGRISLGQTTRELKMLIEVKA